MDFFQFLQKSTQPTKLINPTINENKQLTPDNLLNNPLNNPVNNPVNINQETIVYKNIKKGDFVKIIYKKNSILNIYKGYIGEIKEYKIDQNFAVIFLHGISYYTIVKFPIEHFLKIDT